MTCGVYKVQAPSGNLYIGSSNNIERRFNQHKTMLRQGSQASRTFAPIGLNMVSARPLLPRRRSPLAEPLSFLSVDRGGEQEFPRAAASLQSACGTPALLEPCLFPFRASDRGGTLAAGTLCLRGVRRPFCVKKRSYS
jgi:hypothetical protein